MGTRNINKKGGKKFQKMQMRAKAKVTYCCEKPTKLVKVNGRPALQCRVCYNYVGDVPPKRERVVITQDEEEIKKEKKEKSRLRKLTKKYLGF